MATNSRGAYFTYDAGDTAGPQTLEECRQIGGPDGTAATIDTTHLLSSGKEYLTDIPDFGDITLTCNYTGGTVQLNMFDAFTDSAPPAPCTARVKMPDGTYNTFSFNAVVTKWSLNLAVGSQANLSITVHVSGGLDFAAT